MIRSPFVHKNEGHLVTTDMAEILNEAQSQSVLKSDDYPVRTHSFILELMRAFQLAYATEDEKVSIRYLVPELLPEFEPPMDEAWDTAPVHLRLKYEVLPHGLLPRLIVRTHALSEGSPHWRHGLSYDTVNQKYWSARKRTAPNCTYLSSLARTKHDRFWPRSYAGRSRQCTQSYACGRSRK